MTFSQLQYLLEVHKTGSFSQAAKNLFISQPSISLTLKALEEELGYPIFQRTKKGLIPTQKGADVIAHAVRICESYRMLTEPGMPKSTSVRISAASVVPVQKAFLRLIAESRHRRDISFSMTQESNDDCIAGVQNFSLDVGFYNVVASRYLYFLDTIKKSGLEPKTLATMQGVICISKEHPLFHKENLTPADFENEMFLDSTNAALSRAMFDAGITKVKQDHGIISSQNYVRKELVRQGLAYEITYFIPNDQEPGFRYIPVEGLSYKLIAMTNPLRSQIPEIDRFMELVQEELRDANL